MDIGKYKANTIEKKWYDYWMKQNYFHSKIDNRPAYTIVIPPPNVTGVLHMGHMLNNTIQDVLVRRARLKGFNACWVPGTDHASIATEAKVVAKLQKEGISKSDLTREEFLKHAWEWTDKHGGIILEQLKKIGASCDWERTAFTLDETRSASVIKVFVDLYNQGLIYKGYRMVNWDPQAQTTLSDEEVIYEEKQGNLYYISYPIKDSNEKLTIATTRPETIFGDTAICVHPDDQRFKHLHGKSVIVPIVNREINIITDTYVDMEFGTGCLKITPAHDPNDKVIGDKYQLDVIDIFNADATLNAYGLHYKGKDRFEVRKEFAKELKEKGYLIKIEQHNNKVGTSERTKAIIEPRVSEQWFLKMEELAKPALEAVLSKEVNLVPERFVTTYRHWMENIRDWNISRQLWWGHQIPAYYYSENKEDFVVANNKEEALVLAKEKTGNSKLKLSDLRQDQDALDTWFSSWLWPISVFNGILEPENKEIQYYYPTNDLVTGPDIIFFWVARMVVAGYHFRSKEPFKNVYFTGIVRDKQRRKMSKQLGNSPDALKLIEDYGADGVRVGLLLSAPAGNDLMFDIELCKQGSGFVNKIWNAFKLIKSWKVSNTHKQTKASKKALEWYQSKFQITLETLENHYSKYRISDALMTTYKLIWDDFCSWLLEIVKPGYEQPIDKETYQSIIEIMEDNLRILHPFIPFATEEIWHQIKDRTAKEALIVNTWPTKKAINQKLISDFEITTQVISGIRTLRKQQNISFKEQISLKVINSLKHTKSLDNIVSKLGNVQNITYVSDEVTGALSFRVASNEYFIPVSKDHLDIENEIEKIKNELNYTQGFLKSVMKKLANERFVNNAPDNVVAVERKKQADAEAKIKTLTASLERLNA